MTIFKSGGENFSGVVEQGFDTNEDEALMAAFTPTSGEVFGSFVTTNTPLTATNSLLSTPVDADIGDDFNGNTPINDTLTDPDATGTLVEPDIIAGGVGNDVLTGKDGIDFIYGE